MKYQSQIKIVLVRTIHPGNLGSILRAMQNMGVRDLALVSPQFSLDEATISQEISKMALSAASLLKGVKVCATLSESLGSSHLAIGTTHRVRYQKNRHHWHPRELSRSLQEEGGSQNIALVFGPEDSGLSNEELSHCQRVVTIPTHEDFTSLNLSQSVMILLYELSQLQQGKESFSSVNQEERATVAQIEAFYEHWEKALKAVEVLDPQNPYRAMNQFRELFSRAEMTAREVALFRALARKIIRAGA